MAYNLESLTKILEQILQFPHLNRTKKPEIESLLKRTRALKQLFGNSPRDKIEKLGIRIRDAAYEAEDILESHLVDRIRSSGEGVSFIYSPPSLQKVIEEFASAEEEIKQTMDTGSCVIADSSSSSSTTRIYPNPHKILVGLSNDSLELKDRLAGHESKLEIIPIVGMGGIGKTTLAQSVYDDPLVVSHFDTRAWVTISLEYNVRKIILGLLECVSGKLTDEMCRKQNDELSLHLHKSLWGRRYLIVLDDMWDGKAWDDVKWFFPVEKNGSRVMVTTRELSVANYVGSNISSYHQMHLLDKNDSWDLLRRKVFAQDTCPPELEEVGGKIAENCRGLPLAIHVIGGVLSQANRTRKYWVQVEKDVASAVADNEQFSKILSLSYDHLPNHLKPCFLYMSAFPEDYEIRTSYLIRLWVAEGFLEPILGKSLEEAAEMYLRALVDRNLVLVRRKETNGVAKSYSMHDLLRDLCVRKACQDKFLYIKNEEGQASNIPRAGTFPSRRVVVGSCDLVSGVDSCVAIEGTQNSMKHVRSVLYMGRSWLNPYGCVLIFRLRLLRVLDILSVKLEPFRMELLQLVNLRYLALTCLSFFPPPISTLLNLQTIILRIFALYGSSEVRPEKIFDMPQVRHIKFLETHPVYKPANDAVLKENLQTLSGITVSPGFGRIIESVPHLKKLGIADYCSVDSDINLTCLRKLETLKVEIRKHRGPLLSHLILPPSLKKLSLSNTEIPLGYMNEIGTLPNLEILKLRNSNLESSIWEPTEGEFSRLQFLLLERLNLAKWEVDDTHFPRLERLIIRDCSQLEEICSSIGDISSLEVLEVEGCSSSVVDSARRIYEEQLELGNDGLRVLIAGSSK